MTDACGGCQGLGAHTRWCPTQVGTRASLLGLYAERAEALADAIGSLDMAAANDCYGVARRLSVRAMAEASLWKQSRDAVVPAPGVRWVCADLAACCRWRGLR